MQTSIVLANFLKNPYAWGFVLFWIGILIACSTLWVFEIRQGKPNKSLESLLFWIFGLVMLIFAVIRPIGIARDDLVYLEYYETICPTLTCGQWLQGPRDVGWYSSLGFLKSFFPEPRIMLWLGATGLLVKLAVIYSLVSRPMFALLPYAGIYYQVQDLTAWRVSLALTFLMVGIWFIVRTSKYWNAWILLLCGLFHKQASVAPLIIMGAYLRRNRYLFIILSVTPVALLITELYPPLHLIVSQIGGAFKEIAVSQGLNPYIQWKILGVYSGSRLAPVVVYPQILLTLWLLVKAKIDDDKLDALLCGCLFTACLFLWVFASLPNVQVRFFEFFMVPTVLLAGIRRLNGWEFLGVVFVSGIVVAKYNVVHQLIVQP